MCHKFHIFTRTGRPPSLVWLESFVMHTVQWFHKKKMVPFLKLVNYVIVQERKVAYGSGDINTTLGLSS